MMYSLVLDLAADKIPVAVTCRVLGFSKRQAGRPRGARFGLGRPDDGSD